VSAASSPWRSLLRGLGLLATVAAAVPAQAGHELPFYPSYYPQEIRLETLEPSAAAGPLRSGALHAYVGGDPFAGGRLPGSVSAVDSLGAFVVLTVNPAAPAARSRESRCELAARAIHGLAAAPGFVPHPYPVTPYHPDYLEHFDLIQARRGEPALEAAGPAPRLRAKGVTARRLLGGRAALDGQAWDALLEEIEPADLLPPGRGAWNGWIGPPWLKQGWFHAYLLLAPLVADAAQRGAAEALLQRLTAGAPAEPAEAAEHGRRLVGRLSAGCERAVAGYTVRREAYSNEFSQGIENVARDSQAGLDSHIFVRTAKLKDFPWNGWLRAGISSRPQAAWNPLGGFTDPAGRLLWAALGDPAFLPAPAGADWLGNRVTLPPGAVETGVSIAVPEDALAPEPGTGLLREVGKGRTARARVTYRAWTSGFHDNTRMTPADLVYAYSVAARWGDRAGRPGEHDPAIEAATALARQSLVGFRVLRVESEVRKYADVTFTYVVPVVEVYLASGAGDPATLAALAPPWSAVPWHLVVLMEEAVKRGVAAFSPGEARRRGVPWLDLARDARVRAALGGIAAELAGQGHVPPALARFVNADEAQSRWAALRAFGQKRGHYLVTNGPYRLERWSDTATVLSVFRDFSYPLGVGSYDRHAIARRAYVTKVTTGAAGLEVQADVERVEKFLRDWRLVREPLAPLPTSGDRPEIPLCRYVVIGAGGEVVAAGSTTEAPGGKIAVRLGGRLKPGAYTVLLALALGDNWVNPEVAVAKYQVDPGP
jgi:hypothetical protein